MRDGDLDFVGDALDELETDLVKETCRIPGNAEAVSCSLDSRRLADPNLLGYIAFTLFSRVASSRMEIQSLSVWSIMSVEKLEGT